LSPRKALRSLSVPSTLSGELGFGLLGHAVHLPLDALVPEEVLDLTGSAVAAALEKRLMEAAPAGAIVLARPIRFNGLGEEDRKVSGIEKM
jgi:hypothetical protein